MKRGGFSPFECNRRRYTRTRAKTVQNREEKIDSAANQNVREVLKWLARLIYEFSRMHRCSTMA
jgi:hypothetical protein